MALLIKTLNGLAYASVKARSSLGVGSIKTINGLDATGGGGDPDFASVTLLLHCDGVDGSTSFPDNSNSNNTVTAGGSAQVDTAQFKFGDASALLDGVNSYLQAPTGADFQYAGDFTIEFWVRFTSTAGTPVLYDCRTGAGSTGFVLYLSGGAYTIFSGAANQISGGSATTNTWIFVTICRDGTDFRVFIDGTQVGSTWSTSQNFSDGACFVGAQFNGANYSSGNLDEIRVTNGVARYNANFTPPTSAFPNF
jgi:hypothetical protein